MHTLLCQVIHASSVKIVLLFSFNYERTTLRYATLKKMAVEPEKHEDELDKDG